jgi:hypothetical protein
MHAATPFVEVLSDDCMTGGQEDAPVRLVPRGKCASCRGVMRGRPHQNVVEFALPQYHRGGARAACHRSFDRTKDIDQ